MKRKYSTGKGSSKVMFIGREVERTPMFGELTLFVDGVEPVSDILAVLEAKKIRHVYCGANQSFHPGVQFKWSWEEWDHMVCALLDADLWVTLDFDVKYLNELHDCSFTSYNRFIPMVSVKMPYISLLNHNTTIKLDDVGFDQTNPGVWCHSLHTLTGIHAFTDWDKYEGDTPL